MTSSWVLWVYCCPYIWNRAPWKPTAWNSQQADRSTEKSLPSLAPKPGKEWPNNRETFCITCLIPAKHKHKVCTHTHTPWFQWECMQSQSSLIFHSYCTPWKQVVFFQFPRSLKGCSWELVSHSPPNRSRQCSDSRITVVSVGPVAVWASTPTQ